MPPQHTSTATKIGAIAVILIVLGVVAYLLSLSPTLDEYTSPPGTTDPNVVACTLDAKICPDGSYVGRVAPSCQFAACPGTPDISSWTTYSDSKVSFVYPGSFSGKYIQMLDWPPQVSIVKNPFTCVEAGSEMASAGKTERRPINGTVYCVTTESEGAAGSIYTNYAYAVQKGNQSAIFTFGARRVQCPNYDEPEKTACEVEQASFNIDTVVDLMAQNLQIKS